MQYAFWSQSYDLASKVQNNLMIFLSMAPKENLSGNE